MYQHNTVDSPYRVVIETQSDKRPILLEPSPEHLAPQLEVAHDGELVRILGEDEGGCERMREDERGCERMRENVGECERMRGRVSMLSFARNVSVT